MGVRSVSETVQDRDIVIMESKYGRVYALPNGATIINLKYVTYDLRNCVTLISANLYFLLARRHASALRAMAVSVCLLL